MIRFHIADLQATGSQTFPISFVRLGQHESEVASDIAMVRAAGALGAQSLANNGWEESCALRIGRAWRSGVYVARVHAPGGDAPDIFFVVRRTRPDPTAQIVIQIPTTTINAYNNWGGSSLYEYNSGGSAARAVSFNRPQQSDPLWPRGYGFQEEWDHRVKAFVQWMEAVGYEADFITNNDLHESGAAIDSYRLFISIGHDEYWSGEMRDNFDRFVARGGNAAIFGGNTCYWRIRLEPDEMTGDLYRRLVCCRAAADDGIKDPRLNTVAWKETGYPENASLGAGFAFGGWKGGGSFGAFTVYRPEHWAFAGTGLRKGDRFGSEPGGLLLGYETSGVDFVRDSGGSPVPTGSDGTPMDYQILALAELPDWGAPGNAAMGILANRASGGSVFNAATTDWAKGLATCLSDGNHFSTVTAKITRNVVDHLIRPDLPR